MNEDDSHVKMFKMELEEHTPHNKNNPCSECVLQSGPMCLDKSYCEFHRTGKTWKKYLTEDEQKDRETIISQLVLATESINQAMEKLTDLYSSKDNFVRKTAKYVAEVLLGEASRITTFWADELVDIKETMK